MDRKTALAAFYRWDQKGRFVFTHADLKKIFAKDTPKTLQEGISRMIKSGLLERVSRGIYIFSFAHSKDSDVIEHIAKALRRGEYNYVSLESALSLYGIISQIPIDRLTVMTTGCKGTYHTPYGTIEFTHTKRKRSNIIANIQNVQRPLRMASPEAAWRDLKRVGRNTHLIDQEALKNYGT